MNVDLANEILASFDKHLGDTPLTWLRALLLAANQQQLSVSGQTSIALADLDKQLQLLGTQPPSDDARRQRLTTINSAAQSVELLANHGGKPPLQLKSRQKNIALSIDSGLQQTLSKLLQSLEREQVRNATTLTTPLDPNKLAEPKVASKEQYQVFISHAWEDEDIEAVVDKFVNKLDGKLRHLPSHWERQFSVKVYFDREHIHGRSLNFEAQTDPACRKSAFGLFLVSDKWYASPACQREANHFKNRHSEPDNLPYTKIQLCGRRDSGQKQPLYPEHWRRKYPNLLRLFADGTANLAEQDDFLDCIRDEICSYLAPLTTPPSGGGNSAKTPALPSSGTGAYTSEHDAAIKEQKTTKPRAFTLQGNRDLLPKQELDDTRASEEILPLLRTWANSANGKNRVVALLGSFGSGKTVTSQLFARALADAVAKDPSQPEPIYLDLRRLQELYSIEAPVKPGLSQIIATALSKAEGAQLADAESILRFIRSQPCVVIFDGLDEVGNRIGVEAAAQLYRQLLEIVPAEAWNLDIKIKRADWQACPARIMVTCRSHFFRNHLEEISSLNSHDRASHHNWPPDLLQRYYMAPLSREQVREVLIKNLGEAGGQSADELLKQAHDLPTLARKPILARYISDLLPELIEAQQAGRALNTALVYQELFQRCIARDGDKNPLLNIDDRTRLLQALALELWQRRAAALPVAELDQWFDSYAESQSGLRLMFSGKAQTRNLLHTELHNANLLVRSGSSDFAFVHSSFYEYFLALALFNCPDLQAYQNWPQLSAETCAFIWEIAINADKKNHDQFFRWQQHLLTGELPKSLRALIVQISRAHPEGWAPPSKANLSDLDLSNAIFGGANSDNSYTDIDLTNANLRGCRFLRLTFQSCNFQGANIAQARFEHCHWQECSGTPSGVAAARAYRCTADPTSSMLLSSLVFVVESPHLLPEPQPLSSHALQFTDAHRGRVRDAAFSPDGSKAITAYDDGAAKLWDAKTGVCLLTLGQHLDRVNSAAFSSDASRIVTASSDSAAKVWDATTGTCLLTLDDHKNPVSSAAFNSNKIVTASDDGTAKVWDANSGTCFLTLKGHQGSVLSAAFSSNGSKIITASYDRSAKVWDANSGICLLTLEGHQDWVRSAAFSTDGSKIITASDDHTTKVWDANSGTCLLTLEGHQDSVRSAAFSTDGSKIITASDDATAKVWDATTGACLLTLEQHQGFISSAAFSFDGNRVITASRDRASIWDATTGACLITLGKEQRPEMLSASLSADGSKLVTASNNGSTLMWDLSADECILAMTEHQDWVRSATFSYDDRKVITASGDETAKVWDASTGACLLTLERHKDWVLSSAFSKDGSKIVTASGDKTAKIWDANTATCILNLEAHKDWVRSAIFSYDGHKVITASDDKTAKIWDAATGTCLITLDEHQGWLCGAAFSSDGSKVATASNDCTAKVWDASTGACLLTLDQHRSGVVSAVFSNDSSKIVTASFDNTAKVWSSITGACLLTLEHQRQVYRATFSSDDSKIITTSADGAARLWNANSGQLLRRYQLLPEDNWVVLDGEGNVLRCSTGAWPYVYGLSADGTITSPSNHPDWARISAPVKAQST